MTTIGPCARATAMLERARTNVDEVAAHAGAFFTSNRHRTRLLHEAGRDISDAASLLRHGSGAPEHVAELFDGIAVETARRGEEITRRSSGDVARDLQFELNRLGKALVVHERLIDGTEVLPPAPPPPPPSEAWARLRTSVDELDDALGAEYLGPEIGRPLASTRYAIDQVQQHDLTDVQRGLLTQAQDLVTTNFARYWRYPGAQDGYANFVDLAELGRIRESLRLAIRLEDAAPSAMVSPATATADEGMDAIRW